MENNPMENPNVRPEIDSQSDNFDAKGTPRSRREMPDGTVAFLSEEEYKDELESQRS